jgi:hypothetical protein
LLGGATVTFDRVLNQDCIAGLKQFADSTVDLAFADPPFNIGYDYDIYHDKLESENYLAWSRDWTAEVVRVLKPTGTFWLAIGDEYAAELKLMLQRENKLTCRSWVVWYYTFGVNCKAKFSRSHAHLFHMVKDPDHFTFNAEAVRVPSARQLVYGDRRAHPTGRLPDDTWILRPQDVPETSRACAARSRSAPAGTAAKCPNNCWAVSCARAATRAIWFSIRSPAAARRWPWPRNWGGDTWASNFQRTMRRGLSRGLPPFRRAIGWTAPQNRWLARRTRRAAEGWPTSRMAKSRASAKLSMRSRVSGTNANEIRDLQ